MKLTQSGVFLIGSAENYEKVYVPFGDRLGTG